MQDQVVDHSTRTASLNLSLQRLPSPSRENEVIVHDADSTVASIVSKLRTHSEGARLIIVTWWCAGESEAASCVHIT
jgi:hypothetical protein